MYQTDKKKTGRWQAMVMFNAALLSMLPLAGCNTESSPAIAEPIKYQAKSTALADNVSADVFQFESYQVVNLSLNVADYASELAGNVYVVKLSDQELNTVYLSAHEALDQIEVSFSVPLAHSYALMEVYSDMGTEGSIMQEINL